MHNDATETKREDSRFWKSQPVGLCKSYRDVPGYIEDVDSEIVPDVPVALPNGLRWDIILTDRMDDFKAFLDRHYVADKENRFRLCYRKEFLKAFLSEGEPDWHLFIMDAENDNILGSITAVRRTLFIREKTVESVEVNFLCVHAEHRQKRLAEFLVREVTRRVNRRGIYSAIHTSGSLLPQSPFCTARYYHKFLDIRTLNAAGYTGFPSGNIDDAIKQHQHHPKKNVASNALTMYLLRPATIQDIPVIKDLFDRDAKTVFLSEAVDEVKLHKMMTDSGGCLQNFVIEEITKINRARKIIGFVSTYDMDLLVVHNDETIATSYVHYHAGTVIPCIDVLFSLLQKQGRASVNCLNVGKAKDIVQLYDMLPGTGLLHYYLYNYRVPILPPEQLSYLVY